MKWKDEKENLQNLINSGLSYEEIGRMYGCSGNNIKKSAKRLGIFLKSRRSINEKETFNKGNGKKGVCEYCGKEFNLYQGHKGHYCSLECYVNGENKKTITQWKNGTITGYDKRFKITPTVRKYILESRGYKCEICGCDKINPYTNKTILQIHHIDGDASNCSDENLQVLCPNCHAMTENFGSRNKNSGRTYRKNDEKKPD